MSTTPTTVSPKTEQRLRDAMDRLLSGSPQRTDGRLTKSNLHKEAGVSRATMNRATNILQQWNEAVTTTNPRRRRDHKQEAAIAEQAATIRKLRQRISDLQEQLTAAGTVIADLHQQNLSLRGEIPTATVTPLPTRGRNRR